LKDDDDDTSCFFLCSIFLAACSFKSYTWNISWAQISSSYIVA